MRGLRGTGGRRPKVTRAEALERRHFVLQLMCNHVPDERIVAECAKKYQMTTSASRALIRKCEAQLVDESKEHLPVLKSKAVNRLHRWLASAAKDKSWNAVSSLERTLAKIQGTESAVELHVNVDAEVRESVVHLLSNMPPHRLQELAQQGAAMLAQQGAPTPPHLPPAPHPPGGALPPHPDDPPGRGF